jgi:hypothetical protein
VLGESIATVGRTGKRGASGSSDPDAPAPRETLVEAGDASRWCAENDHRRTQVLVALPDEQVGFVQKPDRPCLRRHVVGGHTVQPDGDSSRLATLPRPRDLAEPMDHCLAIFLLHPDQLAGVAHAVDLVDVGERRHVVSLVEAVHRVGQSRDQQPTGLQMFQRAAQKCRTPGAPSEQLQRLHRYQDEREPAAKGELPCICDHGFDGQPGGALLERVQERRVDVERDDWRTASR